MPSPVTPAQICETIPSASSDLCTRLTRFFNLASLLCDFFSWFLDSDGSVSDTFLTEVTAEVLPPGTLIYSAASNMGTGWLLCNGQTVSRTTYANLFTAIGTRYGIGDGSTTFTMPDVRGRSLIGAGQGSGLTNRDISLISVGEESHVQTLAELVGHTHDILTHSAGATGGDGGDILNEPDPGTERFHPTETTGSTPPTGMNVVHPCVIAFCYIKV